jgi:hypothetical protein
MERECNIEVYDRKTEGYPRESFIIDFFEMDELITKIDECIELTGFRKVDVYLIDDGQFITDEIKFLESEDIIIA